MKKNFGDLHKLRLLKFDSGDIKESKVSKGEINKSSHFCTQNFKKNLKCSTNGLNVKCSQWMKTKSTSETSFKAGSSRKRRNSNIFKSQSNQSKRPITKRSVSLYNLKQHLSSTSFLVTNPTNWSFKAVAEKSFKRQQVKHDRYNKTDVHVLFMSETQKAARKNIKPNICDDKRKLDWINNSKSSNLFSFKSNQHYGNKNYQSHKNNNRLFTYYNHNNQNMCNFKQYKENIRDPVRKNDRTINLKSNPYGNTMPMRYNLVDFSCAECNIGSPYKCIHKISTFDPSPCNKQVWVTTNCLDIPKNVSGDSDNFSCKMLRPDLKINNTDATENMCNNKIREIEDCKRRWRRELKRIFSSNFFKNPESLAKFTLKYFLFVIAVIIWSPCILLMCIYWLLTYTVHPLNILEKPNISKINLFRYVACRCNCCQPILKIFANFVVKINSSYNTFFSMLKKQKNQQLDHFKSSESSSNNKFFIKSNRLCPNPNNKYSLSYSLQRGWTIKPLKKCQRNIDKKSECKVSNVVTSPESNICRCLPLEISSKDACSMPPHDLISNKDYHHEHFHNRYHDRCLKNPIKDLRIKSRKNVSFEGSQAQPLDLCRSSESEIMSPCLNVGNPCSPNTLFKERVQVDSSNKVIERNPPCSCQLINNVTTQISSKKPIPIPGKQNPIDPKYTSTEIPKTASPPDPIDSKFTNTEIPKTASPSKPINPKFTSTEIPKTASPPNPIDSKFTNTEIRKPAFPSKPINPKYTSTEKRKTVSRPNPIHSKYKSTKIRQRTPHIHIEPRFVYRRYESKGKKLTKKQKVKCWCKSTGKNVREIIHDVECEVWKCHCCKDLYIQTLRRRPCFWVYRRWPSFYPYFLVFHKFYENVVVGLMFIISTCIWVPILCWSYICFSLFCQCRC